MPLASTIQEDNREEVVFNKYFGGKYKRNYISQDIQAWLAALLCCACSLQTLPVMKTGFSLCCFSLQGKTFNENSFFPVKKNYTGKTLFSLQGKFAV